MKHVDIITGDVQGKVLGKRYRVGRFLDKGESGRVYKVTDTLRQGGVGGAAATQPLVIKIQQCTQVTMMEINTLEKIGKAAKNCQNSCEANGNLLQIRDWGHFVIVDPAKLDG